MKAAYLIVAYLIAVIQRRYFVFLLLFVPPFKVEIMISGFVLGAIGVSDMMPISNDQRCAAKHLPFS
jgi:type III secretory pathway component EscR